MYLEREAGRLLQAADLAVEASEEGDVGGWLGGEVEVVVQQLAPLHEHERALLVRGQVLRGEAHDGVGDGASLRDTGSQGPWPRPGLSHSAGQGSPGAPGSRCA